MIEPYLTIVDPPVFSQNIKLLPRFLVRQAKALGQGQTQRSAQGTAQGHTPRRLDTEASGEAPCGRRY